MMYLQEKATPSNLFGVEKMGVQKILSTAFLGYYCY
jgi:hypothetical protein